MTISTKITIIAVEFHRCYTTVIAVISSGPSCINMAFQIGKIDCFDGNVETWNCYKERLDQYYVANEVADNKQVAALLALMGSTTYRLLRDISHLIYPQQKLMLNCVKF